MIRITLSADEVKAHFSECIDLALQGGYVLITRYGKPVAAIVSFDDLEQLQRIRTAKETGGLADLANGWEDADTFAQELDKIVAERYSNISPSHSLI